MSFKMWVFQTRCLLCIAFGYQRNGNVTATCLLLKNTAKTKCVVEQRIKIPFLSIGLSCNEKKTRDDNNERLENPETQEARSRVLF